MTRRLLSAFLMFGLVLIVAGAIAQTVTPPLTGSLPDAVDQWTTIVGMLLPLVIAVVNRTAWPPPLKSLGALGVCVLAAAGDVALKGQFDLKHWAQNALTIFFLTVTTYYGFWKPTGIADAVEKRTG
jgi:hypothetical protein